MPKVQGTDWLTPRPRRQDLLGGLLVADQRCPHHRRERDRVQPAEDSLVEGLHQLVDVRVMRRHRSQPGDDAVVILADRVIHHLGEVRVQCRVPAYGKGQVIGPMSWQELVAGHGQPITGNRRAVKMHVEL